MDATVQRHTVFSADVHSYDDVVRFPFDDVERDIIGLRDADGAFIGAAILVILYAEGTFRLRGVGPFEAVDGGGNLDIGGRAF